MPEIIQLNDFLQKYITKSTRPAIFQNGGSMYIL